MRKKITSLVLMLACFVGTAMADLSQPYYKNSNFWVEATDYPEALDAVVDGAKVGENSIKKDGAVVQWASNSITVTADGDVVVTFAHNNGGDHMLNMLGVDAINAEGNVVASDYHYGTAGGNPVNNAYTLSGLTANSSLTLRCFVYDNTSLGDRTNSAQGSYTVTNVTGEVVNVVKAAVNLANGRYVFREVNGDLIRYNGEKLARGAAFPDATDDNYIFTITKGNNGFYTIQTTDGKYVTYSGTDNSTTLTTSVEATDENKWWSIREGSGTGLRIIVPSTNDVWNAPGWNYAINFTGANTGVGLWDSNGTNSNWYITEAPTFNLHEGTIEGYAELKIADVLAYSDGTNVVKAATNNNSLFKLTKGNDGHFTIQDANGKYLIYTMTKNHLLTLVDEESATDDNKWWLVTFDRANRNKALDIFPKQASYTTQTPAFNWSQDTNQKLGFWGADDGKSYCSIDFFVTPEVGSFIAFRSASAHNYCAEKYVKTVPAIKNYSGGGYSADRDHTQLVFDACAPAVTPSAVFEVVAGNKVTEFKLKNMHTQEYVVSFVNGAQHMGTEENAVAITFKPLGKGQVAVYGANNGAPMHAQEAYNVIVTWGAELNNSSAWTIEEVDVFSHTLSIGEVGWSTLILGFDAIIPENVEAYAVSEVDAQSVTLEQVTGVLPANTAVLVKAAKGDYNFEYTTQNASVSSKLSGTLYDENIVGAAYVLANKNGVGLYKTKLNQLENTAFKNNANKAYLVVEGAAAPMFSLERGEGTTSIEQIAADAELVIYDLAGRRVEKMEKGIYIVNGKKVVK